MILVDSSVWIALLNARDTPETAKLKAAAAREPLLLGDLMLLEILQGARDDRSAARIERELRRYEIISLLDEPLAIEAARNYRRLRDKGITIRKSADLIIGSYCISRGHTLLHADRDFVPMQRHLGLRCL